MIEKIIELSEDFKKNVKSVDDFKHRNIASIDRKNIVVIGMRRLGKTEYLKYRYFHYQNKDKVVFINLDSALLSGINFKDTESKSLNRFKDDLIHHIKDNKIEMLLIDEIQVLTNWSRFLKGLLDDFPNLIVAATGSDARELNNSSERGGGRYGLFNIGPISFNEFLKMNNIASSDDKMKALYEHLDNYSLPARTNLTDSELFDIIYEKQINTSNFQKNTVITFLRAISMNPGSGLSMNTLSKIIKQESDFSPDYRQVEKIVRFLIESELIYELAGSSSLTKITKKNISKLYPADWNLYKLFSSGLNYKSLNETNNPRKGFVFENYVISNIFSCSMTSLERFNIFYGNDEHECDIVINEVRYEIKSYDVLNDLKLRDVITKSKVGKSIIIHTGETKEFEGVRLINVAEFLENRMWMYLKNR